MDKLYKTLDIYAAWLVLVDSKYSFGGIKNIIGIKISHGREHLFYSILDDCFFRVLPSSDLIEDMDGRLFVQLYEYQAPPCEFKTFGMELYEYTNEEYITKREIIEIKKNKEWLFGYQSDFNYRLLKNDNVVDYENPLMIDENIIDTVEEYEEKKQRPITYDDMHIYGSKRVKKLNKNS